MAGEILNPIQQSVLDALAKRPEFVPSTPELADDIEAHVTDALEPVARHYSADKPLVIAKHTLNSVHGCEAQHVANRGCSRGRFPSCAARFSTRQSSC